MAGIKVFISHAHEDRALASGLVRLIEGTLEVLAGAIRCTSVAGYELDPGTDIADALKRDLKGAVCVFGVITPNSVNAPWVLFELGAAWANDSWCIPLFAGGIDQTNVPGPLKERLGGQIADGAFRGRLIDSLSKQLQWARRPDPPADLVEQEVARLSVADEIHASFREKRSIIGAKQQSILDFIAQRAGTGTPLEQREIKSHFAAVKTDIYYRLETLRMLGFLKKELTGNRGSIPSYAWSLSEAYALSRSKNEAPAPK